MPTCRRRRPHCSAPPGVSGRLRGRLAPPWWWYATASWSKIARRPRSRLPQSRNRADRAWPSPTSTAKTGWSSRPSPNISHEVLGWESVYAYNDETFGPNGTLGRASERDVVLVRDLRAALARLNPDIPEPAREQAIEKLDAHRFRPLAHPAQPRVLRLHPRRRAGRVARCHGRDAPRAGAGDRLPQRRRTTASSPCAS